MNPIEHSLPFLFPKKTNKASSATFYNTEKKELFYVVLSTSAFIRLQTTICQVRNRGCYYNNIYLNGDELCIRMHRITFSSITHTNKST
ncbi:unnamed protein product [Rotaria socialis]